MIAETVAADVGEREMPAAADVIAVVNFVADWN